MAGPLPEDDARRRNTPTIPTTKLPASGRKGRPPNCPYVLGKPGEKWWKWAWSTPQACAWDPSALYTAGRRAVIEDDLAALDFKDYTALEDLLAGADLDAIKQVEWALGLLKKNASGSLALMKEMRELDGKLGLNPEALAKLRWKIVDDTAQKTPGAAASRPAASGTARGRARLRAV